MKKIIRILILIIFISLIYVCTNTMIYANDNGLIDSEELYSATNTYNYNPNFESDSYRYDMSRRNDNIVDNDKPLLTVFTHGLGGDASHWSNNNNNFAYVNSSLITRIAKTTDCNIHWVYFDENKELKIADISKHSIVVFQASSTATNGTNDEVYSEFNYAISKIVYDIKVLNNNKLPKMNLIGHFRGGITNMQYALDHPDLVDSIYSFGTPYTGSSSTEIDYYLLGSKFSNSEAEMNIIDKDIYSKYMSRWNDNYDSLYSDIKVTALGGYQTLLGLAQALTTDDSLDYFSSNFDVDKSTLKILIPTVLGAFDGLMTGLYFTTPSSLSSLIIKHLTPVVSEILANFNIESAVDDIVQILFNEINLDYHPPFISWYNDGLVDLGSQLGYEGVVPFDGNCYKEFNRITKCFDFSNCDFNLTSVSSMPSIIHNLETQDYELGNYILSSISLGYEYNNDYITTYINETECSIDLYIGDNIDSLVIPEYINGNKVVSISDYAFSNNFYGKDIKSITIPKSVKKIGKYAFYNNDTLININFEEDSNLEYIDNYAFSNMSSLSEFNIGSKVNYISENAFENSQITNFIINNNSNYEWKNNILINKNVTDNDNYIAMYVNPKVSSITFPDEVKTISSSICQNNQNIKTIDLNKVDHIGPYAFKNSSLENITNGDLINEVDDDVFYNTSWLNNQHVDFIMLGSNLIKYHGSDNEVVIPEGITKISNNAFESSSVKEIILPTTLECISKNAFSNCDNLEYILFQSTKPPILNGKITSSNVIYYVRSSSYNYFLNSIYYYEYQNQIKVKEIIITFNNKDGNAVGQIKEKYGSTFDNFIEEKSVTGYDFVCFVNSNNEEVYKYSYLSYYYDLVLTPKYEPSKYILNLYSDIYNDSLEIEYDMSKDGITHLNIEEWLLNKVDVALS